VSEQKPSFWDRIFNLNYHSDREDRVLAYIVHRIGDGAALRDILQEEYVRRNASPSEAEEIVSRPELVTRAREEMEKDFASSDLDPRG
jgi:hypothetical protein